MKLANFLRIILVTLALSGYSAWSMSAGRRSPSRADVLGDARDWKKPLEQRIADMIVNTRQAELLWRRETTLFLDVRSASDYEFGHIAGAVSLPEEEFQKRFDELKPRLQRAETIVVYCKSIDCGKSFWSAVRLCDEGLLQTKIYQEGWNEWVNRGLPSVKREQ